ncbi:MAG: ferredoxin [Candidatus Woesearchaeota archaeon]
MGLVGKAFMEKLKMIERFVVVNLKEGGKKRYKIVYDRENCIGAAACAAVDPDDFEMASDGKAELKGGKAVKDRMVFEKEITEEEFKRAKEAAEACPVNVIHIIDLETGEQLI